MSEYKWKVVALCEDQLKDIRPSDILENNLYRIYDTSRSKVYDAFPQRAEFFGLGKHLMKQFVVQLYYCSLDCPYCYVTQKGIRGPITYKITEELIEAFLKTDANIFHLMGGDPSVYIAHWYLIAESLLPYKNKVFHSDLIPTIHKWRGFEISRINQINSLYAVSIKGLTQEEHIKNTGKITHFKMMWDNIDSLLSEGVNFYFTFTNIEPKNIQAFWHTFEHKFGRSRREFHQALSFDIDLIKYDAITDENWKSIKKGA